MVCRLCTVDLLSLPECYSIDEEMENLILMLTSISVSFLIFCKKKIQILMF